MICKTIETKKTIRLNQVQIKDALKEYIKKYSNDIVPDKAVFYITSSAVDRSYAEFYWSV